jgi:hypothetical protein
MRNFLGPRRDRKYYVTLALWVAGLMAALMVLNFIDTRVTDAPVYACPPDCGRPPTALPVSTNPVFTAPGGEFSVSYPAPGVTYDVTIQDDGVTAKWLLGDGGTLRLFGQPAEGRDATVVVQQVLADAFPDSVLSYELPNATVGYQNGYGVVADFPQPAGESLRVIVIAAVKNDLALVAAAEGPFRQFTQEYGPGPPSPANVQIAQDMGKYVTSFSWRGDPPK